MEIEPTGCDSDQVTFGFDDPATVAENAIEPPIGTADDPGAMLTETPESKVMTAEADRVLSALLVAVAVTCSVCEICDGAV